MRPPKLSDELLGIVRLAQRLLRDRLHGGKGILERGD